MYCYNKITSISIRHRKDRAPVSGQYNPGCYSQILMIPSIWIMKTTDF